MDQIVAVLGPMQARCGIANMMRHRGSARRKDRHIRSTLALQLELRVFQAFANLVVADVELSLGRNMRGVFQARDLGVPIPLQVLGCGGVVPVAIDDHGLYGMLAGTLCRGQSWARSRDETQSQWDILLSDRRKERSMDSKKTNRRGFLKGGAAVAGLAAAAVQSASGQAPGLGSARQKRSQGADRLWRALEFRDLDPRAGRRKAFARCLRADVSRRDAAGRTQFGIITPSSLHYVAAHRGFYVPEIDPKEHRLMIHGMVDRPLIFTVDEMKSVSLRSPASFHRVHRKPFEAHA